jgi:hypothetical protein
VNSQSALALLLQAFYPNTAALQRISMFPNQTTTPPRCLLLVLAFVFGFSQGEAARQRGEHLGFYYF